MVTQPKSSQARMWDAGNCPGRWAASPRAARAHTFLGHPVRSVVAKGDVVGSLLRSACQVTLVTLSLVTAVAAGCVPWSCSAWHGGQKRAGLASYRACRAATCIVITYSALHQHDLASLFSGQQTQSLGGSTFRNASSLLSVFCRPRCLLFFICIKKYHKTQELLLFLYLMHRGFFSHKQCLSTELSEGASSLTKQFFMCFH